MLFTYAASPIHNVSLYWMAAGLCIGWVVFRTLSQTSVTFVLPRLCITIRLATRCVSSPACSLTLSPYLACFCTLFFCCQPPLPRLVLIIIDRAIPSPCTPRRWGGRGRGKGDEKDEGRHVRPSVAFFSLCALLEYLAMFVCCH